MHLSSGSSLRALTSTHNWRPQEWAVSFDTFGPMHLRQMTVNLPPLSDQRDIACILGALDDKIELNRK